MGYRKPKKYQTYSHRWGEGKVHLLVWDVFNKTWYVYCCDGPNKRRPDPHGYEVDSSTPITCKKCPQDKENHASRSQ